MIPHAAQVPDWLRPGYELRVKKTLNLYHAALMTTCEESACLAVPGLRWIRDALMGYLEHVPEHVVACNGLDLKAKELLSGRTVLWTLTNKDNIAWLYNDLLYADEHHVRWVVELSEDDDYADERPQFAIMGFQLQEFFLKWRINDERWLGLPAHIYEMAKTAGFAHEAINTQEGYRTLHLRAGKLRLTITVHPQVVLRSERRLAYLFREWGQDNGTA